VAHPVRKLRPSRPKIINRFFRPRPQKLVLAFMTSFLPKGLVGSLDYLEPPQGKMLRLLRLRKKKIAAGNIRGWQKASKATVRV
jgi:hypothetical protein